MRIYNEVDLHEDDGLWFREFPESSSASYYRTAFPFLDRFRLVLIVFKSIGAFVHDVSHIPDYFEGEVLIRIERLKKPQKIRESQIPKTTFENSQIASQKHSLPLSGAEQNHRYEKKDENLRNYITRKDRIAHINVYPSRSALNRFIKSQEPLDIFNYMQKLLQEVVDSEKQFPRVLREWENELFEKDPTPQFESRLRMAREGKIEISDDEYDSFEEFKEEISRIEDPILPAILTFVAAFEPEHMRTYFDYVEQIVEWKQQESKKLDLKVEFRWFVRNYNIRLYRNSRNSENPFEIMLMEKTRFLQQGYNEFCKLMIQHIYPRDFPQDSSIQKDSKKYSISWYRELFDDTNEEEWLQREDIRSTNKLGIINYDRLPLHLLKDHPQFQEIAEVWNITVEDLNKLAKIGEILQIPCNDLSRAQPNKGERCWSEDFSQSFFGIAHKDSKIIAIAVYSDKLLKIYPIIQTFPSIQVLYLNWHNCEDYTVSLDAEGIELIPNGIYPEERISLKNRKTKQKQDYQKQVKNERMSLINDKAQELSNIGKVYEKQGSFSDAVKYYSQALRILGKTKNPQSVELQKRMLNLNSKLEE